MRNTCFINTKWRLRIHETCTTTKISVYDCMYWYATGVIAFKKQGFCVLAPKYVGILRMQLPALRFFSNMGILQKALRAMTAKPKPYGLEIYYLSTKSAFRRVMLWEVWMTYDIVIQYYIVFHSKTNLVPRIPRNPEVCFRLYSVRKVLKWTKCTYFVPYTRTTSLWEFQPG